MCKLINSKDKLITFVGKYFDVVDKMASICTFIKEQIYNVMQSDGNSFFEDVVLDSLNMVYSDEDSIYYQPYEIEFFCVLIMTIWHIKSDWRIYILHIAYLKKNCA